ncbi:hypothetical protein KC340_g12819 [Hortaea werneckii]|nr:hypothetical protein KC342_g10883 [Hortaea werneckii]KAI7091778.1 hypothetical protein KC339_g12520 [Hortaea werneckii]KAI7224085.1 hypothetical protein KC365_g10983 [Hortaea werneckii]KAI7302232.1 hypothetical protein KC340_g12819 [Hortaea werneckii]KAI7379145.1 hypothetical protein KC328_g13487 [Hortaea werneckii]
MLPTYSTLFGICLGAGQFASVWAHGFECPPPPHDIVLKNISDLPDPFKFENGGHVHTEEQWACRRKELIHLFQRYELGDLPGPPEYASTTYDAGNLTITTGNGGDQISFSVNVSVPSDGDDQVPAVIAYGGLSIPVPINVATIVFDNSAFAEQNSLASRGQGLFYDLFGEDATASALTAWSWGVSRIIDALEANPQIGIDPKKLAITGCSRNGKGALVAGAFEERLALTIPQESGAGGSACWRLSDAQLEAGQQVQTASEIVTENVWESVEFRRFANNTDLLPFDHHELAGLVAPRGLVVVDNPDYEWLGPWSSYGCMQAGRLVYEALGVKDHMGYSSVGNHSHCLFPSDRELPDLMAYYERFLLGRPADTDFFYSTANITFDLSEWVNWKVPKLC